MMSLKELLVDNYQISARDWDKAQTYQTKYGGQIEQILVNLGSFPEDKLPELYSELFQLPQLDLAYWQAAQLPELSFDEFRQWQDFDWFPLSISEGRWQFAVKYPLSVAANEKLLQLGIEAELYIASESELSILANKLGSSTDNSDEELFIGDEEERLRELATEAPTVNLLNSLISRGLRQGASDMHLEPFEGRYRVRYRVDGVLHEVEKLPPRMQLPIVTRLKILSGMDIAERRRPQDGKIAMKIANEELDIRVSALPLNDGESIVMRFLRKESVRYDMAVLGLAEDVQAMIKDDLAKTAGVILLTGPTGSGKTTTLYTFLNELNNDEVKIITLEDPVEYQLEGINQVQVNSDIGFDFAAGLRSIVRQDPDIIMLGEIRDNETASIALQSALTGHLVFSTVHTNDAASAYTRLLDLGVDEFLLNAALVAIVAQRLARRICPHCAAPDLAAQETIRRFRLQELADRFNVGEITLMEGKGCDACGHTGYKGRVAVNEYFRCDEAILAMPKDTDFLLHARQHNRDCGRRNLLEDGFYKAILGQTTVAEVLRVAG